jgi:small subunit ribosomal protein S15
MGVKSAPRFLFLHNITNRRRINCPMSTVSDLSQFQLHDKDTGSSDVQVARLTARINYLTQHVGIHKKDFSSRRGLLILVAKRRRILDYLKSTQEERYVKAIKTLGLRR